MFGVVEAQAPNGAHMLGGQRGQKHADVGDLVCHLVLAQDIAFDDTGLLCFSDVSGSPGQDGIAIVGTAVFGEEAD